MKLNLGCGQDIRIGYENIDILEFTDPKYNIKNTVADARILPGILDNSIEEIYAGRLIEHFFLNEIEQILKTWHNKLVDGGRLVINSFDHQMICNDVTFDRMDFNKFNEMILNGGQHHSSYTLGMIVEIVGGAGFKIVSKTIKGHEFFIDAIKC